MKPFILKLKLIYIPYLLIATGFTLLYSFLNWLLIIQTGWLAPKEELINFWLPFCLPIIPILVWVRPRLKLLNLKRKKKGADWESLFYICAWLSIAAPCIIMQEYLLTATGKLTALQSIENLNSNSLTKYYTLKQHHIDKNHIAFYNKASVSGKYNEYLNLYIYVTCPILAQQNVQLDKKSMDPPAAKAMLLQGHKPLIIIDGRPADSTRLKIIRPQDIQSVDVIRNPAAISLYGNKAVDGAILIHLKHITPKLPKAWLGIVYSKQISNHLSKEEKEQAFRAFGQECQKEFNTTNPDNFVYLNRIASNDDRKGYTTAVKSLPYYSGDQLIFFESKNEPFNNRNGQKLPWIFGSLLIGSGVWLLLLIFPAFNRTELNKYLQGVPAKWDLGEARILFVPRKDFFAAPLLIDLNLLVYIAMVIAGLGFANFDAPDLLKWGADYGPLTAGGQWWRLLTGMFLHGGIMHILNNMYGLFFGALFLEPVIGSKRFAISYLVCGIVASLASLWWHPLTVSVGASGAIMGIFGINLALLATNKFQQESKRFLLINCGIFVGLTLLVGLTGGIDNAAHIGGLLCGLCTGGLLHFIMPHPLLKKQPRRLKKQTTDHQEV